MAKWLYRLAQGAARNRGAVLMAWVALLVVAGVLGTALKGTTSDTFTIPGIESQQANDLLAAEFPIANAGTLRAVFAAPDGGTLTDAATQEAIAASLSSAGDVDGVVAVTDLTVSQDQTIGFADVIFAAPAEEVPDDAKNAAMAAMAPARDAGLQVEFGGTASSEVPEVGGPAEVIGVGVAFVVLLVTLGSLVAAGLPLVTALVGVGIGVLGVQFVSRFIDMSSTASTLALMIGLAVGIDYALFIVARHREQLADPAMGVIESIGRAIGTAGSAVVFAGLTVVSALSALSLVGIPFLTVMGLAAAGTVAIAVLVALTLIPAVLAFTGERLRPRTAPDAGTKPARSSFWLRWGRLIQRAPAAVLIAGIVLCAVLALPATHMRLGLPSNEVQPEASTQHQSYELLTTGFGEGFNATIIYVVDATEVPEADRADLMSEVRDAIGQDPDVAAVMDPTYNQAKTIAILNIVPFSGPDDDATSELVERLRDKPAAMVEQAGGTPYVTGLTAVAIDVSAKLAQALPLFVAVIVVLALILLLVAFRSILVPVKAVVGFLLTISVSLGTTVWIFQDGHLADLFNIASPAPIVSFVPVILIGVLFGLAMDYEVFLVSRMRERFHHGDGAPAAVLHGLEQSGRVVCAAALIMASVFGGFLFQDDPIIKSIAFALTIGVLVDAFVVRMTLVPAVMFLLGDRAWALPGWLDRIVPNVDIEGESLPKRDDATDRVPATADGIEATA
jgi:RND superfamily putative drug exporter